MSQIIPIYIPTFISDQNYNPSRVLPHIYFYNGLIDCETYWIESGSLAFGGVTYAQTAFPYFDNYNVVTGSFPTTDSLSLLFNNEGASYGEVPTENLYTQYWETYVELLYNPKTRLLNASAIIPLADYFNIELNDIVNFRGNYYHLRAINDYSVKTGECNLQLLGPIIPDAIPRQTEYTIGEYALGGIVAYIDGGATRGTSGFVAALTDQVSGSYPETSSEWGCKGTNITGGSFIDGKTNTFNILAECATRPIAASYTQGNINGYSDWYLPALTELTAIYNNIGQGASAPNTNIGNFGNYIYWSSTEYVLGSQANQAYVKAFQTGTEYGVDKDFVYGTAVRAIRRF